MAAAGYTLNFGQKSVVDPTKGAMKSVNNAYSILNSDEKLRQRDELLDVQRQVQDRAERMYQDTVDATKRKQQIEANTKDAILQTDKGAGISDAYKRISDAYDSEVANISKATGVDKQVLIDSVNPESKSYGTNDRMKILQGKFDTSVDRLNKVVEPMLTESGDIAVKSVADVDAYKNKVVMNAIRGGATPEEAEKAGILASAPYRNTLTKADEVKIKNIQDQIRSIENFATTKTDAESTGGKTTSKKKDSKYTSGKVLNAPQVLGVDGLGVVDNLTKRIGSEHGILSFTDEPNDVRNSVKLLMNYNLETRKGMPPKYMDVKTASDLIAGSIDQSAVFSSPILKITDKASAAKVLATPAAQALLKEAELNASKGNGSGGTVRSSKVSRKVLSDYDQKEVTRLRKVLNSITANKKYVDPLAKYKTDNISRKYLDEFNTAPKAVVEPKAKVEVKRPTVSRPKPIVTPSKSNVAQQEVKAETNRQNKFIENVDKLDNVLSTLKLPRPNTNRHAGKKAPDVGRAILDSVMKAGYNRKDLVEMYDSLSDKAKQRLQLAGFKL